MITGGDERSTAGSDAPGETSPSLEISLAGVRVFTPSRPLSSSPLLATAPSGIRSEDEVLRRASGEFSSAFVFRLPPVQKGRAQREPGDGVILVGSRVLVLQSKFRNSGAPDSADRARTWVEKETERAARQLRGTVRTLRRASDNLQLRPVDPPAGLSDLVFEVDPRQIESICGVLVINHDDIAPGVAVLSPLENDIPFIRMRQEEWDHIVTVCGSASRLLAYVETLADSSAAYGAQRDDFAATEVGRSHQPFVVTDPPGIPTASGHLATFQLPELAMPSERNLAFDRLFRLAVFGSLMYEAMTGDAQHHAAHLHALALVDKIEPSTRRQHAETLQEMWTSAAPDKGNLQRHVLTIAGEGQLVSVVCPDPTPQAEQAAWAWIEETHAAAHHGDSSFSTVGTRWRRIGEEWVARTIVITSRSELGP